MRDAGLLVVLLLVACATPAPPPKQAWAGKKEAPAPVARPAPSPGAPDAGPEGAPKVETLGDLARLVDADPAGFVAAYPRPEGCERAARALQPLSADRAWKALRLCVERTPFTALSRLTDGFWDRDLAGRADAGVVAAKVIAARGGDVPGDLGAFQGRRIPFFPLSTAAEHPDVYRGRTVFFLARVNGLSAEKKSAIAWLSEIQLVSRGRLVRGERKQKRTISTGKNGYSDEDSETETQTSYLKYENSAEPSGLEVAAQLARLDPFMQPGKLFLVVGRFLGPSPVAALRDAAADPAETLQVVALSSYEPLGAQLVE